MSRQLIRRVHKRKFDEGFVELHTVNSRWAVRRKHCEAAIELLTRRDGVGEFELCGYGTITIRGDQLEAVLDFTPEEAQAWFAEDELVAEHSMITGEDE